MIGSKVAHFEITALLGSGGMGEVYQATDTKLGRSVAIKILPAAFSNDPDRLVRFEREARILASLNHSNIAAILGLEEFGKQKLLVMELVGGETLAERLARGPIPIDEALPIARQICEALEAAHEKGIIHRDLKPANIKITPDGKVKVLDFGLAKVFEGEAANANLSKSPTLSMAATNAGLILGTAAYMSPEQAKGRAVDKRTDIFSFGCVLYEMLTGRAAFDGEDVTDILSRVLQRDPDWILLPPTVPARIRELLQLCLQKDVRKRRSDAADVRIDIEQAVTQPAVLASAAMRGARLAWIAFAAALLAAVVLAFPALRYLLQTPPAPLPETRLEIVTPATTSLLSFALSPDSRQIVFVASVDGPSRLWLRSLAATAAQPLPGTEGASNPFWSPDSRSVGFFAGGKLKRLDIGVGQPQALADVTLGVRGGAWNAGGIILFPLGTSGSLYRIAASGGTPIAVTRLEKHVSHRFPQFLPDGRQFLFYVLGAPEDQGIYLGSLDSGATKRLTSSDTAGAYMSSGWLLFMRAGTLLAQRLDLERGELSGDSVTVADPVAFDFSVHAGAFSAAAAGLVAYRTGGANRLQLQWFDRTGKALGVFGAPDENGLDNPRISPDGRRVAVNRTVQGDTDVWILDGTRTSRFTFDPAVDRYPRWSPDGSRIVFESHRKGAENLYTKSTSGAGSEELLLETQQQKTPYDWSPDGRSILYESTDPQTGRDLWILPLEGERKSWLFLKTNFNERWAQFSPDGRWVAYMSNESGRQEVYVRPFVSPAATKANSTGGQWQISIAGGIFPRWRPDGKELYYLGPEGQVMAVPITVTGSTLEPGTPVALFETRILGGGEGINGQQYDVTRDGRFLINTVLNDAAAPITLLQNWKPPVN